MMNRNELIQSIIDAINSSDTKSIRIIDHIQNIGFSKNEAIKLAGELESQGIIAANKHSKYVLGAKGLFWKPKEDVIASQIVNQNINIGGGNTGTVSVKNQSSLLTQSSSAAKDSAIRSIIKKIIVAAAVTGLGFILKYTLNYFGIITFI